LKIIDTHKENDLKVGSSLSLYGAIFVGGGMASWIINYRIIAITSFALAMLLIAAGQAFRKSSTIKKTFTNNGTRK
jgi:hypothetical protein